MRPLLAFLYGMITAIRNQLFDWGLLRQRRLPRPVISVGNLTMGGVGKTPVVMEVAQWCLQKHLRPVILSRGYGRKSSGVRRVVDVPGAAAFYGDEPTMMARRLPQVPVYVGSSRYEAGMFAIAEGAVDIFILDDGFQHRWLKRDLNLLLIDGSKGFEQELQVFPQGRGRECAKKGAQRASAFVITKSEAQDFSKQQELLQKTLKLNPHISIFHAHMQVRANLDLKKSKVVLACAIANPAGFRKMVERDLGVQVLAEKFWPDHYTATESDWHLVEEMRTEHGADWVLITSKDFVKLDPQLQVKLQVVEMTCQIQPNDKWHSILESCHA